jgi:hypothetical protein
MIVLVGIRQQGHPAPINPPHELPPAENLADEAFGRGDRYLSGLVGSQCRVDHPARIDQLEVQRAGKERVPEEWLVPPHGILPAAEFGQPVANEVIKRFFRLRSCDGPAKMPRRARVSRKVALDIGNRALGDGIGRKAHWRRHRAGALPAERLPIVRVKIPPAADGLIARHQDDVALALPAIEKLHPQLRLVACPCIEIIQGAEEVRVGPDQQRLACGGAGFMQRFLDPVVTGFQHYRGTAIAGSQPCPDGCAQGTMRMLAQPQVIDRQAGLAECRRAVAHGSQKERAARLVAPDVGRFLARLDHQQLIACRVEIGQERMRVRMQLIAQDQEEAAHADLNPLRQASEQYLTSSQVNRHFLRQTMVRPHVAHGLAGRPDLLPRKFSVGLGVVKRVAWVKSLLWMTVSASAGRWRG